MGFVNKKDNNSMDRLKTIGLTSVAILFSITLFTSLNSKSSYLRREKHVESFHGRDDNTTITNSTTLLNIIEQNDKEQENSTYPPIIEAHTEQQPPPPQQQRVVLLVGPHKTSSSSVQTNIIRWTHDNKLPGWAWPRPTAEHLAGIERCHIAYPHAKIFYPYYGTLNGEAGNKCLRKANKDEGRTKVDFIRVYEDEFRRKWDDGMSLVIGSEAMDFVIAEEGGNDGATFLSRVLQGLPWNRHWYDDIGDASYTRKGSNDDVTVVVKLRTPRTDHLISLWHQCCMDKMNFYEYLTIRVPNEDKALHSIDSLRLAQMFLDRGIKVTLIDMEGASDRGFDISDVIACDVLNVPCTTDKEVLIDDFEPSIVNVKNHTDDMMRGISGNQLALMEKTIRNYDCNFQGIMRHENITTLYPDHLRKIFDGCESIPQDIRIETRHELGEILRDIAVGGAAEEVTESMINK